MLSEIAVGPAIPPKRRRSHVLAVGASLLVLAGLGWVGEDYWTVGRFEVSTDDAYVKADSTTVAPKVSGYLDAVNVEDNQPVMAGRILAHIDDRDFKAAVDQARANVSAAEANVARQKAALETQQSIIEAARAAVEVDAANQTFAHQDDRRYAILAADGYGSAQNSQQASSRVAALKASIARDNAALTTSIKQVDQIKADLAQAEAALTRDQANLRQAELNLSYTTIVAAVDGTVGNRTLRVGQYVQSGTQLMTIVPLQAAYLVANFKETQLTHVRAGQPVEIEVDMFPGVKAHGHVDSLAPASGQEFALLPPDNATGNFTKIVQRIPVKIILDPGSPLAGELRPGMSVGPTIMTKPAPHTVTASAAQSNPS
ncbi:MAG TPA: HlyD family secretion protein [Alphaproteobacteria bacterium]|nr:HlyD family secretion protein [Alphaproteobacteria bacterium]